MVPLLQRLTFEELKSKQNASPHHSAPRLGSVCPLSGLNPWAAATRHPWRGAANPASCRVTHGFKPTFGQRGLTGRLGSRSRSKTEPEQTTVYLTNGDPNVGAGLLANAVCQSANSLADPPHSRASPLPQFDPVRHTHTGRLSGRRALAFDLEAPRQTRWPNAGFGAWVTRQDAGLAALGQGWPIAAAHAPKPE